MDVQELTDIIQDTLKKHLSESEIRRIFSACNGNEGGVDVYTQDGKHYVVSITEWEVMGK